METPSGELSVADFQTIWLEDGMDPPSFTQGQTKKRKPEESHISVLVPTLESIINPLKKFVRFEEVENGDGENEQQLEDEVSKYLASEPALLPIQTSVKESQFLRSPNAQTHISFGDITDSNIGNFGLVPVENEEAIEDPGNEPLGILKFRSEESLSDLDNDPDIIAMCNVPQHLREFKEKIWTAENSDWILKQEQNLLNKPSISNPRVKVLVLYLCRERRRAILSLLDLQLRLQGAC